MRSVFEPLMVSDHSARHGGAMRSMSSRNDRDVLTRHRRTGQHPFGGADRVLPEWIQWGGGVVAEIFRDQYSVGGGG